MLNPSDAVIADVADQQVAVPVEGDAVRPIELGLSGRAAIAREARLARTGQGRDLPRRAIHLPDGVVVAFDDVQIARAVEAELVRHVQRRLNGWSAVAGVATLAAAGNRGHRPGRQIQTADSLVAEVTEVQPTVRS